MVRGSCLCGAVAWQATGKFVRMSHCHCTVCRKLHGTGYGTYCATEDDGFSWVRGEPRSRSQREREAPALESH